MGRELSKIHGRSWLGVVAAISALGALIAGGAAVYGVTNSHNASQSQATAWYSENSSAAATATAGPGSTPSSQRAVNYAKELSKAFHQAAANVAPSVVTIVNMPAEKPAVERKQAPDEDSEQMPFGFQGMPFGDLFKSHPELRHFFKESPGGGLEMPEHSSIPTGSGVIVDPSGVILTNNHVVKGGGQILVRLSDGREFKAFDIKTDPTSDLALLHVKSKEPLPAAKLGNSQDVDVGDWVLAVGEPFGLEHTVTAGIVSAKSRGIGINEREDYIQTDAAINPGNSGGPLVNLDGEVIGINTAISSSSGGYQGVGFAIPINLAKWVGEELVKYGTVHRAYLGVMIQPVSQSLAEQFSVKTHEGVLVTQVEPDTPAAKAGLKVGDLILAFAGKPVTTPSQLQSMVEMCSVNSSERLTILRNGKQTTLDVVCAERPTHIAVAHHGRQQPGKTPSSSFEKLGIQIEELTPEVAEQLGVESQHGVVITHVRAGSPADLAGLGSGMVIAEVDRRPVSTVEDFREMLNKRPLSKGVLLLLRSGEGSRFVVIQTGSE